MEAGRVGGEALVLSEEQAVQVAEITERLHHIEGMVDQARELGNPHIIMTLEPARYTLLKQCVGSSADGSCGSKTRTRGTPNI